MGSIRSMSYKWTIPQYTTVGLKSSCKPLMVLFVVPGKKITHPSEVDEANGSSSLRWSECPATRGLLILCWSWWPSWEWKYIKLEVCRLVAILFGKQATDEMRTIEIWIIETYMMICGLCIYIIVYSVYIVLYSIYDVRFSIYYSTLYMICFERLVFDSSPFCAIGFFTATNETEKWYFYYTRGLPKTGLTCHLNMLRSQWVF